MIKIEKLSKIIEEKLNEKLLNSGITEYQFNIVCDTAEFKRPLRNKNDIFEFVNGYLNINSSDTSSLNSGALFSTLSATLKIIMRMKGYEDNIWSTPENENELPQIISFGDKSRISNMRALLDSVFQENSYQEIYDENTDKKYLMSTVYEFAQTGTRAQVEKLGDSFTFSTNIYYTFVEEGINTRSAIFILDGVAIPYQAFTCYRTPTMDGNVYANTNDGATKNLSSQTTLSISFELPALLDITTSNMFNFLFDGELNQAHLLTMNIGAKVKNYIVTYGENKLIGETIKNLGQNLSLVECPTEYDLIHFADSYYIYEAMENINELSLIENAQTYLFGSIYNGFLSGKNAEISKGDYIVSTKELSHNGLIRV